MSWIGVGPTYACSSLMAMLILYSIHKYISALQLLTCDIAFSQAAQNRASSCSAQSAHVWFDELYAAWYGILTSLVVWTSRPSLVVNPF